MARKLKNVEDEKLTGKTNNMARNTEKPSKRETHTISPKICQEKVKNVNNEKYTLQDLDYCQNTINVKMRQKHYQIQNMLRNTEKGEK